ncbi:hypothetical protein QYM36_001684, partial [Artemia franciscana]
MVRFASGPYTSYGYTPSYGSSSMGYSSTSYTTPYNYTGGSSHSYIGSIGSSLYSGSSSLLNTLRSFTGLGFSLGGTPVNSRSRQASTTYDPISSYRYIQSDPVSRNTGHEPLSGRKSLDNLSTSYQRPYESSGNYRNYYAPTTYYTPIKREGGDRLLKSIDTAKIDLTKKREPGKPGEIKREQTYGTIRRNRQVVRMTTQHLPDAAELEKSVAEKEKQKLAYQQALKMPSPEKEPCSSKTSSTAEILKETISEDIAPLKKTKAQKLVEKYMIPSVKKETQKRTVLKYGREKDDDMFPEKNLERKMTQKHITIRPNALEKRAPLEREKVLNAPESKVNIKYKKEEVEIEKLSETKCTVKQKKGTVKVKIINPEKSLNEMSKGNKIDNTVGTIKKKRPQTTIKKVRESKTKEASRSEQ